MTAMRYAHDYHYSIVPVIVYCADIQSYIRQNFVFFPHCHEYFAALLRLACFPHCQEYFAALLRLANKYTSNNFYHAFVVFVTVLPLNLTATLA